MRTSYGEWMGKIISEFNHCDRSKEFYKEKKEGE